MMKSSPRADGESRLGCLGAAVLYPVFLLAPALAFHRLGPPVSVAFAFVAVLLWARFGPRPFPGLLPGLLSTSLLLGFLAWSGLALRSCLHGSGAPTVNDHAPPPTSTEVVSP